MEPAVELIDRSLASNDWSEKFNLADKLAALLAQIEPSGMMRSFGWPLEIYLLQRKN